MGVSIFNTPANMNSKTGWVAALAAILFWTTAQASNTTTLVAQGRADLVQGNWTAASSAFQAAGNLTPTNAEAQTLAAITELLAVWQSPGLQNLVARMGYDFGDSVPPVLTPLPDGPADNANISEGQAFAVSTLLPLVQDADARLAAAIKANPMTINLSAQETGTDAVKLDQGDLLLLRTFAQAYITAVSLGKSVNFNASLNQLINLQQDGMLDPGDVRQAFPQLFSRPAGTAQTADLTAAKTAFALIGTLYNSASTFIRTKRNNSQALFQISPSDYANEAKFRTELALTMTAASGPATFSLNTTPPSTVKLSLAPIFNGTADFAQLAPAFGKKQIITSSIPDPTFGGIFASGNASFFKGRSNKDKLFTPFGPAIATQPAGVAAAAGSNVTLTGASSVTTNVSYYWTLNNVFIANNGNYSGTTTPKLKITGLSSGLAGTYRLVVASDAGISTSTGAVVSLLVTAPSVGAQPSNTTVVQGNQAKLTVLANGTGPFIYQWTFNGKALANGGNVTGATAAQLVINNAAAANAGKYAVTITNAKGKVTSNAVTLTVLVKPSIVTEPKSPVAAGKSVKAGTTVSLTVKASGSATLTYQWQFNGKNLSNGGVVSGATTVTLKLTKVTSANSGTYLVNVTNGAAGTTPSSTVTLTIM